MPPKSKKRSVAVRGSWLPVSLNFLRSRACAQLSPLAAKLLLDIFAFLGPNATRNGDISLAPKLMAPRGWTSRASLASAVQELTEFGLLAMTRQSSRKDCALFACTLFPLDCDFRKLDVRPGAYLTTDFMGPDQVLGAPPTETSPATWRRARKTLSVSPPRNEVSADRSAPERKLVAVK